MKLVSKIRSDGDLSEVGHFHVECDGSGVPGDVVAVALSLLPVHGHGDHLLGDVACASGVLEGDAGGHLDVGTLLRMLRDEVHHVVACGAGLGAQAHLLAPAVGAACGQGDGHVADGVGGVGGACEGPCAPGVGAGGGLRERVGAASLHAAELDGEDLDALIRRMVVLRGEGHLREGVAETESNAAATYFFRHCVHEVGLAADVGGYGVVVERGAAVAELEGAAVMRAVDVCHEGQAFPAGGAVRGPGGLSGGGP